MTRSEQLRRIGALYLFAQGLGTVAWWIGLFNSARIRSWFVPTDTGWDAVRHLVVPDIGVFGGLSLITAVMVWTNHRLTKTSLLILSGAALYATAVAYSWLGTPVNHWLGAVAMTISFVCTSAITWRMHG